MKIDLRRFLPLSNIKYLPIFAGKHEFKTMFGLKWLVYSLAGSSKELLRDIPAYSQYEFDTITTEFAQIGDPVLMWTKTTDQNPYHLHADARTLAVTRDYEVNDCYSIITNFGIDCDIHQSLVHLLNMVYMKISL